MSGVDRATLNAWRLRGRGDAFAHRPSAIETARARHGEKAAEAYLAGWRIGARARGDHDALHRDAQRV